MISNNIQPIINAFQAIGYNRNLIKRNYEFSDFSINSPIGRKIDLGIFGQEPLDYHNACFGVHFLRDGETSESLARSLRSFGSPQFLIILNGKTERWRNAERQPILREEINTDKLESFIKDHKQDWNPDAMIRLKSGIEKLTPRQIDFIDVGLLSALEHEASQKIDSLIKSILRVVDEYKNKKRSVDGNAVFTLTFQFLTAKLLKERNITTKPAIDYNCPVDILEAVSNYYKKKFKISTENLPRELLQAIVNEINQSFSFRNLSVDTLTYVYENTLVTPESRKKLGIHSTPSYVADYVLSQLPLGDISPSKWKVFDPTCGSGIFLIAAMRRMRSFMPKDWGGQRRHKFFTQCLFGTEIDPFTIEVALMCLTLADFPEADGWRIKSANIFKGKLLENTCSKTTILVGNPPFEVMKVNGRERPKPTELLRRALPELPDGSLMGMVLPKAFLDSLDYRKERDLLLKNFDVLSVTSLPDKIFCYADSETSIIVAQKGKRKITGKTIYKEVRDADRDLFKLHYHVTWEDVVPSSYFSEIRNNILAVPFIREVWEYLNDLPKLNKFVDIKVGAQYQPNINQEKLAKSIQTRPFEGSQPAVMRITQGFYQYEAKDTYYISTEKKLQRRNAWDFDWSKPKIVVPRARNSRGPWHHIAAIDNDGRIISHRFFCIWTKDISLNVETLAALLNSPIGEAYTYAYSSQKNINKDVYGEMPVSPLILRDGDILQVLVRDYLSNQFKNQEKAKEILLKIDAEILKSYNLPPKLERKVLDLFWGKQRPVPFTFTGYIPPENESWIPLHVYMSEQYQNAISHRIFENFPLVNSELIEFMKTVGTED